MQNLKNEIKVKLVSNKKDYLNRTVKQTYMWQKMC